jgi:hypothetical protein
MSTPAHADPNTGLLKSEPALITAAAVWLVGNLGLLLVGRLHWFTAAQWSGESASLTAVASAAIASLAGWLLRRVVTSPRTVARMAAELAAVQEALAAARAAAAAGSIETPPAGQPIASSPLAGQPPSPSAGMPYPAAQDGLPALTADMLPQAAAPAPGAAEPSAG